MSTEATVTNVPQHVLDYLGEHKKLTLATASTTSVPHAATFMFVNPSPNRFPRVFDKVSRSPLRIASPDSMFPA